MHSNTQHGGSRAAKGARVMDPPTESTVLSTASRSLVERSGWDVQLVHGAPERPRKVVEWKRGGVGLLRQAPSAD